MTAPNLWTIAAFQKLILDVRPSPQRSGKCRECGSPMEIGQDVVRVKLCVRQVQLLPLDARSLAAVTLPNEHRGMPMEVEYVYLQGLSYASNAQVQRLCVYYDLHKDCFQLATAGSSYDSRWAWYSPAGD